MTIRIKKQWAKIDNENATNQKTEQAKCEETWTSSFKNQRQRWGELGKALPLAILAIPRSSKSEQTQWACENSYWEESPREINLEKSNCISLTMQCNGSRQLQGAIWAGWTPMSGNPGLSHSTQDLKAPNFGLLQDLCWAIILGTRPPGCWLNQDASTGLFAERELLPLCQTRHFGTSPVSQTLAERSQTLMQLYENWFVLANGHFMMKNKQTKKVQLISSQSFNLSYFIFFWSVQQKTEMWERMWWYEVLLFTVSRPWQLLICTFSCHENIMG